MYRYTVSVVAALLLAPALSSAQDAAHGGHIDTNRIGVMSPMVAQQQLRMLGYTNVTVIDVGRAAVRANAVKGGRTLVVRLDPSSGRITEVPGRLERRPKGLRLIKPNGEVVAPPQ